MYRTLTLILLTLCSLSNTWAQQLDTTFRLIDKEGKVLADGEKLTFEKLVNNNFGEYLIDSGLLVENTTDAPAHLSVDFKVTTISGGSISFCFPQECYNWTTPKEGNSGGGTLKPKEKRDLRLEWLAPFGFAGGELSAGAGASMTLTFNTMNNTGTSDKPIYNFKAKGSTIHVVFAPQTPTGIASLAEGQTLGGQATRTSQLYTLSGQRVKGMQQSAGIYLLRQADGRTRKVLVR